MKVKPMTERNKDNTITIWVKNDEVYLKTILGRLRKNQVLFIKVANFPDQMIKVAGYYHLLKWFGIREIDKREKVFEPDSKDSLKIVEFVVIKWEVVGRLMKYREEYQEYLEGNDIL